jgi:hypothetical protein
MARGPAPRDLDPFIAEEHFASTGQIYEGANGKEPSAED